MWGSLEIKIITGNQEIKSRNLDQEKQNLGKNRFIILVQDKGRWSKDSTFQLHPPGVPWVERIKIGGRN